MTTHENIVSQINGARQIFLSGHGMRPNTVFLGAEEIALFERKMKKDLELPEDFDFHGHKDTMIYEMNVVPVTFSTFCKVGLI